MEEIKSVEQFYEVVKEEKVFIDFYADWCGPCKMMEIILEDMVIEHPEIKFYRVNTDKFRMLAQKHGVISIPVFMIFSYGKVVKQKSGALRREELNEFINS